MKKVSPTPLGCPKAVVGHPPCLLWVSAQHGGLSHLTIRPKILQQVEPKHSSYVVKRCLPQPGEAQLKERGHIFGNGWQSESLHDIIKRLGTSEILESACALKPLQGYLKGDTDVTLPAHSVPSSSLWTSHETISEGNRTVVSQTDSTHIFPQRIKKKKKKAKQDERFFKSEPFLHLSATSWQNLWVCWRQGIKAGSTHGQLKWREVSRLSTSYQGTGEWMAMLLFTNRAL